MKEFKECAPCIKNPDSQILNEYFKIEIKKEGDVEVSNEKTMIYQNLRMKRTCFKCKKPLYCINYVDGAKIGWVLCDNEKCVEYLLLVA